MSFVYNLNTIQIDWLFLWESDFEFFDQLSYYYAINFYAKRS